MSKSKKELCIVMIVLFLISLFASGCNESQQSKKWGEGELPEEWQRYFGNGNNSRLNKVQTDVINKQEAVIYGFSQTASDGKVTHIEGLIKMVAAIDANMKNLIELNAKQHKKMGEVDITFQKRIKALESQVSDVMVDPKGGR